ncbi:MAG TPA: acyl carrier protein [Ferruginibacter sp.]|jgi:acyl carrier protein|nr:acyl carrier protein [Ferruginibacter sp.]MBN8698498.1 acyl carrier protein [Chitinophagales bacterium]HMU72882.1 acyl carrier protein [Ferruginibacter sp.]HMX35661.1 acyl carrier protein [Ferruginibacter sp.]HMX78927.1 acyl carrier protein [Ferruginibacter sp.]
MDRALITEKLTTIFRSVFNDQAIVLRDDLTANDVANWDSLSHMLMIGEAEKEFSVKFKLKELGKLEDVKSLIDLLEQKIQSK